jgi:hypothetical protein
MNRKFLVLVVPALAAGLGWSLFAQDAPPRITGKVLLLQNDRAFEGDIEKVGEAYRVRKGTGELVISVSQALRLCTDWDDALAFMRSRANLGDPDERLRLARWLHLNHQIDRAREEARVALEMRPKHAETRQLVKLLEATPAGKTARPASEVSLPPVPHYDLSFESVTTFSLRVQPILMNTCVNCHSGSYGGPFRLYRLHEGGERISTQRNLAAVIAQLQLAKPAASPLLVMAVSAHGNAKASPIPGRQSPMFATLCSWIDQTLADNPHLRERPAAAPATLPASVTRAPEVSQGPRPLEPKNVAPMSDVLPGVVVSQTPVTPPPTAPPAAAPTPQVPVDEFSAVHFNRWAYPQKK